MISITLDNNYVYIRNVPPALFGLLREKTSYRVAGYQHTTAYQEGRWDGKKYLLTYSKAEKVFKAPAGLAEKIVGIIENNGIKWELTDLRIYPKYNLEFNQVTGLRPYQQEALALATEEYGITKSIGRGIIKIPPRGGKTLIASAIVARLGVRTLFIVPSQLLLYQSQKALSKALETEIGILGDGVWEPSNITVSTAQTLLAKRNTPEYHNVINNVDLMLVDECFPAGTIIDERPIESIKVGEYVTSYNENTKKIEKQKVINIFRNKCKQLVIIKTDNKVLTCTPTHPIFTQTGWKNAIDLTTSDMVLYTTYEKRNKNKLFLVQKRNICKWMQIRSIKKIWSRLLFKRMFKSISKQTFFRNNGKNKQEICIRKNEKKQSNEKTRNTSKGFYNTQNKWMEAANSRWKWERANAAPTTIGNNTWVENGIYSSNEMWCKGWITESLQDRHCEPNIKNCDRGRRFKSQYFKGKSCGSKERQFLNWSRVESVEILKSRSSDKFKQLCPDGYVYNLEVENTHTYFANKILVHNCHHFSSGDAWRNILLDCQAPYKIGLSATVFLENSNEEELGVIWLRACAGEILIDIPVSELIRLGYLVKPKFLIIPIREPDLSDEWWSQKLPKTAIWGNPIRNMIIADIAEKLIKTENRKVVIVSNRLEQVDTLFKMMNSSISCERIVGATPAPKRAEIIENFRKGHISTLIGTVLSEGVDIPEIDCVINAEGGKNIKTTYQRLRCLTLCEGKKDAVFVDFADMTHGYFAQHSKDRLSVYKSEEEFDIEILDNYA